MLAAIALATFAYAFAAPIDYEVRVDFDGYIPMLGGIEAKVNTVLGVKVQGEKAPEANLVGVSSDLTSLEVRLDGEKLPFTADNARQYFPKTTVGITHQGKVVKNDAKDLALPVRLPGLDAKRFPEMSYLPVEFPAGGYEMGTAFTFEKPFGDSKVAYVVIPKKLEGNTLYLDCTMRQAYETLEDESKNLVKDEKDAFYKVRTKVDGAGSLTFDTAKGRLVSMKIDANSVSEAKQLKSGEVETRKLKTTLRSTLK